jgi:PIN domain nuclease of toxin-antitoxin system
VSTKAAARSFLLDTHAALFALERPHKLSSAARDAVLAGRNVLSAVVYWEVVLKSMKGTLDVGDPRVWWQDAMEQLAATALPLHPQHVSGLLALPPIHKDPFDRTLIAQAIAEGMVLVSTDAKVTQYASARLKVIW